MNLRQFEVFRAIMRDGTITAAANSLGISQPAVSKLLAHLEDELGYALFDRIAGRLVATMEAQLIYADVDRAFRQFDKLSALTRDVGAARIGLLRIGSSLPIAYSLLPEALALFQHQRSEVKIHLHTLPKREIADALLLGDIDVAITLSPILAPTVRVETLCDIPIVVVCTADDSLQALELVRPADLSGRRLISYGSHAEIGTALDRAFEAEGEKRDVSIQIASSIGALPLVRRGLGVALVDTLSIWRADDVIARRFLPEVTMQLSVSVNQSRPEARFAPPFLRCLREALASAKEITVRSR
ncbi:LysR family transcriptional regulator [Rhizobium sp. BR 315]|uniref:LysR family transcriptional regulator n=1 Tax=Rhizobium sp. BR 315 TaxID=3040014 RepID=UPI003D32F5D0